LGQGKLIILFIKQILKLTIRVDHHSANLVRAPLYNVPSAPSIGLFSQSSDHLNGREWTEWKKKGLKREYRSNILQKVEKAWARKGSEIGQSFTFIMLRSEMRPQKILLYDTRMVIRLGDEL
jgi:hypothetical protein